ncbi:MAG: hypothetical protein JRF08_07225 [Deltaproteobacteria bacterium]|nr:hypothetical protein [Deltaproteobacteria bacterium]
MKIALATDDNMGLDAVLSHHFGRCPYYIVVDVDDREIKDVKAVKNPFYESHGQTGDVPNQRLSGFFNKSEFKHLPGLPA